MLARHGAVFFLLIGFLQACGGGEENTRASSFEAMPASYIHPQTTKLRESRQYLGRFDVLDRVDLRARVSGYVDAVKFDDGQRVKRGDTLFVIDQRPFMLALNRAQAELKAAESSAALAQSEYERGQELRELRALSQEVLDQRAQTQQNAQARLAQAKVALKQAQLDLGFSRIKSPIDGYIGQRQISVGNLVQAGSEVLATVVAAAPLYFHFELNERDALRVQSLIAKDEVAAEIVVAVDGGSALSAVIDFMDVQTDRDTGTIALRAKLNSNEPGIKPGMFGRAQIPLSEVREALLVPDILIGSNQNLKTLMLINEKNQVAIQPVVVGKRIGDQRVIWQGVDAKAKVINAGIQKLQPGMPVTPQAAEAAAQSTDDNKANADTPVEQPLTGDEQ